MKVVEVLEVVEVVEKKEAVRDELGYMKVRNGGYASGTRNLRPHIRKQGSAPGSRHLPHVEACGTLFRTSALLSHVYVHHLSDLVFPPLACRVSPPLTCLASSAS